MEFKKSSYTVSVSNQILSFYLEGKKLFSVGASALINGEFSNFKKESINEDKAVFSGKNEKMTFEFLDDCIKVAYSKKFDEETPIYVTKMFAGEGKEINVSNLDRGFTPQARNNRGKNLEFYRHLPDISANGYFSPSLFNFSLGNSEKWVSFGLLDIPDTKICKMDDDKSFLIESCGGNKVIKKGGTYNMPSVLITFPQNEWDGIKVFREKLKEFGLYKPKTRAFSELPSWWKNPFVCTYGDQMLEDRVGQLIDEEWVLDIVKRAEEEWGFKNINLIIDDSWQLPHSFEPAVATDRFPDIRRFIDGLHDRGHHVILWQTSMFDVISNGFETRAQRLGVLSDYKYESVYFKERGMDARAIDYTADNARQFLREICEIMFGSGEGQYNADGVKLDFIGLSRDPAETKTYMHPEKGLGAKELLLFYEMFSEEARKVKSDVIIDCTVGDPRFEHAIDFNRLHDTHCGTIEKDIRAYISSLACPNLPIDSDGALMYVDWIKAHYISSAIYGVPSLYYIKDFHDVVESGAEHGFGRTGREAKRLSGTGKKHLANLLQMTKFRPDGKAEMTSYGNWVLKDNDKINAMCQRGETVVYYPTDKNDTGYIFTWQSEVICIPLYGRKISSIQGEGGCRFIMADYAKDIAYIELNPGEVYTFKNEDDGTSIDRNFIEARAVKSETEMNYVNN